MASIDDISCASIRKQMPGSVAAVGLGDRHQLVRVYLLYGLFQRDKGSMVCTRAFLVAEVSVEVGLSRFLAQWC